MARLPTVTVRVTWELDQKDGRGYLAVPYRRARDLVRMTVARLNRHKRYGLTYTVRGYLMAAKRHHPIPVYLGRGVSQGWLRRLDEVVQPKRKRSRKA